MKLQKDFSLGKLASIIALGGGLSVFLMGATILASPQKMAKSRKQAEKPSAATLTEANDLDTYASEMRSLIERYTVDRGALDRTYPVAFSPTRRARFAKFYSEWRGRLAQLDYDSMDVESPADFLLFENHLRYQLKQLEIQDRQHAEIEPLLPFAGTIVDLEETRWSFESAPPLYQAAYLLGGLQIRDLHHELVDGR